MPVLFIAHGAPMVLDDADWMRDWSVWGGALPRPTSILMVSAHWEARPVALGATTTVPLVYDFYGFPEKYYRDVYPAPGAPALAARVKQLLAGEPVQDAPKRGLDHGAYVPLMGMYPKADVPVLQVSLPTLEPAPLLALGRRLAPLRDEGVLIVGSGFITHNMRAFDMTGRTQGWASEFDAWTADVVRRRDHDALAAYREKAPGVNLALPTHEHFVPLLVAAGAARDDEARFPIEGWLAGNFTRRSVHFG
jgi:4,5-DOPA dioxygenase extradiol